MIVGVGVDITLISRIERNIGNGRFMEKLFTKAEISYINSRGNRAQTAAGMFCAKEALLKAMGKGLGQIAFHKMEVLHRESGAPYMNCEVDGTVHLSISHTGDMAIAQVVVESEE